ncbi:hypothetical protein Dimus_000950 [Dionaea muscipula]
MHIAACKEFYANLTVYLYKKKEVARSRVRGVEIELDNMILASILVSLATTASNVVPRFGKRDTTSFMDLTYMDHILTRRLVNLPRVMLRHMAYVISVENHELPYGDWLTMVFEAFNIGGIRRDDEEEEVNNEAPAENMENEKVNEEEEVQQDFDWEAVIDEVEIENQEAKIQGKQFVDKEAEVEGSGSGEKFFDVVDEERSDEAPAVPAFPASPADSLTTQKAKTAAGVDPSGPVGSIPNSDFQRLQAELKRARVDRIQAELDRARAKNARLQALL